MITADIVSDPLWANYRDAAVSHGLRASWSQPIMSKNREVLGTFAMYYTEPRSPSGSELQLIEGARHLALIAIEGAQAQAALTKALDDLKKSEAQLRTLIDTIPQTITVWAPDGSTHYVNQAVLDYTGLTLDISFAVFV